MNRTFVLPAKTYPSSVSFYSGLAVTLVHRREVDSLPSLSLSLQACTLPPSKAGRPEILPHLPLAFTLSFSKPNAVGEKLSCAKPILMRYFKIHVFYLCTLQVQEKSWWTRKDSCGFGPWVNLGYGLRKTKQRRKWKFGMYARITKRITVCNISSAREYGRSNRSKRRTILGARTIPWLVLRIKGEHREWKRASKFIVALSERMIDLQRLNFRNLLIQ